MKENMRDKTAQNGETAQCACPIISSNDFTFYYGATMGVKNITMNINPCSVTAIIGPSGCGKSTFLRSINRMNDLIPGVRTQGKLVVDGQDIYDKRVNLVNLGAIFLSEGHKLVF